MDLDDVILSEIKPEKGQILYDQILYDKILN